MRPPIRSQLDWSPWNRKRRNEAGNLLCYAAPALHMQRTCPMAQLSIAAAKREAAMAFQSTGYDIGVFEGPELSSECFPGHHW